MRALPLGASVSYLCKEEAGLSPLGFEGHQGSGMWEGRGGRPVAGRGRAGVALAQASQRGHVSSMGSVGRAGRPL